MSNLLEKASILLTPTAYDDGKVLSVKPEDGTGDFTFTRNSSATRVNEQGFVEDVQILSSNLVQNGDFSQEGSELVTNGDFATDSDWFKDANWTIANGKATSTGVGRMFQSIPFLETNIGTTVQVSFDIIDITAGGVVVNCYGGVSQLFTTVGTHTFTTTTINNTNLYFNNAGAGNLIGSIDNVSVKEVGQDWTLGTGWSIGDDKATATDAAFGAQLVDDTTLVANKKYKVTFDISDYVKGSVRVGVGNVFSSNVSSNGSFTFIITSSNTNAFKAQTRAGGSGTTLSISNISVIEITDDTNLPRIDYTGGTGHWLFEPQSTNRMTTSEPTSGGAGFTFPAKTWANGLINGLNATEASSGTKYWYMSSGIANEYSTFSFFVEMEDGSEPIIGNNSDANTDFVVTVKGWFMAESDITKTNTIGNVWKIEAPSRVNELANTSPIGILKYGTQSNKTFSATGFQIEQSSYATSYIPTNGSTVTRLQDAAFGAGSSDLINSTEGVLYWEGVYFGASGNNLISVSESGSNNYVALFFLSGSTILSRYYNNGSIQGNINYGGLNTTDYFKIAFSWSQDNFSLWVNGVRRSLDTSGNIITPNVFNKINFASVSGSQNFFGKTKCLAVFKEALTDEELTCLTTI